jgi:hypothetical protein
MPRSTARRFVDRHASSGPRTAAVASVATRARRRSSSAASIGKTSFPHPGDAVGHPSPMRTQPGAELVGGVSEPSDHELPE